MSDGAPVGERSSLPYFSVEKRWFMVDITNLFSWVYKAIYKPLHSFGVFHKWENPNSWMVYLLENPMKMDDLRTWIP
jgi:hypothetical protein